jgi:hypothetical protein
MPDYGVTIAKINASSNDTPRSFLYAYMENDADSFQVKNVAIKARTGSHRVMDKPDASVLQ